MYLKNLQLSNFKNYEEGFFEFDENVNAIIGENGSGKTNLLDAIHYLAFCKSYFLSQDQPSVRFDCDFFALHGEFVGLDDGRSRKISCIFKNGGRKIIKLNQKEYDRMSDHIGQYPLIMVAPVDSNLLHGESEIRRRYFDMAISQFDKEYLHQLIAYQRLLKQRNSLLKQMAENGNFQIDMLQIYDFQIVPLANFIFQKRKAFIETLLPTFQKYYDFLSESKEQVHIEYVSSLSETPIEDSLRQNWQRDLAAGHTCTGIHKDDFDFLMKNHSVRKFSSQGQQKSFILALKLSQFDHIYNVKKVKPILLLDDIFDKLDEKRTDKLLTMVGQEHFGQVFLSDTNSDRIRQILDRHCIAYKMHQCANAPQ